uniref:Uncharacterized protein n=1 Tax=Acrobeloides nanus TaxID=290746 RepID=A0A914CW51_9BILA
MLLLGQPVKRFFLQPRMRFSHGFLFLLGIYFASTECPRNLVNDVPQAETNGPPGMEPEEHFIQTTFIYRDLSDDDQSYSRSVMDKLSSIRLRLKLQARVTIDNENVDCTDNGFSQCREYPLNKPYHFLVVEDSSHGAAVYSVDKKYNVGKPGVIEMSLLDALSRHSLQPLVTYASEEAEHQVGFVRELSAGEIDGFLQENAVLEKKKKSSIFIRSPLELNLIDQRILDLRLPNLETSLGKLQV